MVAIGINPPLATTNPVWKLYMQVVPCKMFLCHHYKYSKLMYLRWFCLSSRLFLTIDCSFMFLECFLSTWYLYLGLKKSWFVFLIKLLFVLLMWQTQNYLSGYKIRVTQLAPKLLAYLQFSNFAIAKLVILFLSKWHAEANNLKWSKMTESGNFNHFCGIKNYLPAVKLEYKILR